MHNKLILLLLFFLLGHFSVFSQNITVTGEIKDQSGEPLYGVNVTVKPVFSGTITDFDGKFSLQGIKETDILEFSYVGFETQSIKVGSQRKFSIVLVESSTGLDEVQVIAYGTQSKLSVTGSMSSINSETLLKSPTTSVTNSLAGAMTGVSAVQSIGQPGKDDALIFIRGSGTLDDAGAQPLVLVDGVERPFSQLDPNEIDNITVLKDASSTAVFGVRGANGVIIVTTKRGTQGKKTVSVNSSYSIQMPTRELKMADSYTTALLYNEKIDNDGSNKAKFSDYILNAFKNNTDPLLYPNVNQREYIFRDFYSQTQHNVSISGGTEKVRFFTSLGYMFQDGMLKKFESLDYNHNFSHNRFNYRTNLDIEVTNTTDLSINLGGRVSAIHEPIAHNDGLWRQVVWSQPYASPGIIDGKFVISPADKYPVALKNGLDAFYGKGEKFESQNALNFDIILKQKLDFITQGLSASIKATYNSYYGYFVNRNTSVERYTQYYQSMLDNPSLDIADPSYNKTIVYKISGSDNAFSHTESFGKDRDWYMEGRIDYDRTFAQRHKISALLLYNQNKKYYPDKPQNLAYIPHAYVGLVGRFSYNYMKKYLFDLNAGYNGSENFAPGKTRYGFFPSGSVGWILSEEAFMKTQDIVSFLKLRVSYGIVGNDYMKDFRFLYMADTYGLGSGGYSFGVNSNNRLPAATEGLKGNPGVSWEKATKQNYGIDLKLFDDRLSVTGDLFHEFRSQILISLKTPPGILAMNLPILNLGEVENKGYEVELKWQDKINKFNYWASANVSYAKNKIIYMDEVVPSFPHMAETGRSTGSTYGYEFERFYTADDFEDPDNGILKEGIAVPSFGSPRPGDMKYIDRSKDGIINTDDQTYLGYAKRPEYIFGFNAGASYRGFSFSMQWTGATNVTSLLATDYRVPFSNNGGRGLMQYMADERWTPETAETATFPRFSDNSRTLNIANSSFWTRDASYLRLKNAQLGYNFGKITLFRKIGVTNFTAYLSGYNIITFDKLKIVDPEAIATGGNTNMYPVSKIYSVGVKMNF